MAQYNIYDEVDDFAEKYYYDGIEIWGDKDFLDRIKKSLELLRGKAPEAYRQVKSYIGRIVRGQPSAVFPSLVPPTFKLNPKQSCTTIFWCASVLAHESCHSKLWHEREEAMKRAYPNKPRPVNVERTYAEKVKEEKRCNYYQLTILQKIGGPESYIDYLRKADGKHFDINKDGKSDWFDHKNQTW